MTSHPDWSFLLMAFSLLSHPQLTLAMSQEIENVGVVPGNILSPSQQNCLTREETVDEDGLLYHQQVQRAGHLKWS